MLKKKSITAAISAITLLGVSACGTTPAVAPILLPPKPIYPSVTPEELSCMSQEAYSRLVEATAKCDAHVDVLTKIIKAHNEEATK